MSSNIARRPSSKQGLQNLQKLTEQRSFEDAEEIERERRRRARELSRSHDSETDAGEPSQQSRPSDSSSLPENELKPKDQQVQEEDEGFSDWSHKMERPQQQHPAECGQAEKDRRPWSGALSPKQEEVVEHELEQKRHVRHCEDVLKRKENVHRQGDEERQKDEEVKILMKGQKVQREDREEKVKEKKKEVKVSYVSTVFMEQEAGPTNSTADVDEVISPLVTVTKIPRGSNHAQDVGVGVGALQNQTHRRQQQRECPRLEKTQPEQAEVWLEGLRSEGQEGVTAEHLSSIMERTETLNYSLQKSNDIKKTQSPAVISKIDGRLEQYAHAIESSAREAKSVKQTQLDLPTPPEPVASKKNLFEAGDAWNQNVSKSTPSKDAEGLKVGVADLISQWVRGNLDDSGRNSSPKPADVKSGDVLHIKNLWETLGDSKTPEQKNKGSGSLKKYKFVVTGHGKYEKIPVEDDHHNEFTNGQTVFRIRWNVPR